MSSETKRSNSALFISVRSVPVRKKLRLSPGDDFEVTIEDEDTIVLRRVTQSANRGLVDLLLSCPEPFEIPPRENDDPAPLKLCVVA